VCMYVCKVTDEMLPVRWFKIETPKTIKSTYQSSA